MATDMGDILESPPWAMVNMVILWSSFMVKSFRFTILTIDYKNRILAMVMVKIGIFSG